MLWICLDNEYLAVLDRILYVHKTLYVHLFGDLLCICLDRLKVLLADMKRRDDACGVAGMYARELDMLHYGRHESVRSVGDGVRFTLCRVI